MFNVNASAVKYEAIKSLQIVETVLLLAGSILLQFSIHFIPASGTPLGAILLAMFFAPLIAAIFFKPHVAFTVGILAPLVNYLLTGSPRSEILTLMTIELVVFISFLYLFFYFNKTKKISALFAILIAIIISPSIASLFSTTYQSNLVQSITTAIPGIILLSLLNYFLVRYKEKS